EESTEKKVCFVMTGKGPERRPVEIGLFNDDFVEIKSGLVEQEQVLYNPPRWDTPEDTEETQQTESIESAEQKQQTINAEQASPAEGAESPGEIVQTEQKNQKEETEAGQAAEAVILNRPQPD
ncbi:hypothetical protein ACFLZ8_06765, partial [Planctomycetota bacterium]